MNSEDPKNYNIRNPFLELKKDIPDEPSPNSGLLNNGSFSGRKNNAVENNSNMAPQSNQNSQVNNGGAAVNNVAPNSGSPVNSPQMANNVQNINLQNQNASQNIINQNVSQMVDDVQNANYQNVQQMSNNAQNVVNQDASQMVNNVQNQVAGNNNQSNYVNQSDYLKAQEANKYAVKGIDVNSFFDVSVNKTPDTTNDKPSQEITEPPTSVPQNASVSSEPPTTQSTEVPSDNNANNAGNNVTSEPPSGETSPLPASYNPALDFEKDRLEQLRNEEREKELAKAREKEEAEKEKKKISIRNTNLLKIDFLILTFVSLVILVITGIIKLDVVHLVHGIIDIVLFVVGYKLACAGRKEAAFIGAVVAISMIAMIMYDDVVDFILGIILLVHSLGFLVLSKKNK